MSNLLTYGSLMYGDVLFAVTGVWRRSERASLANHRVYRVRGKAYPALLRATGEIAHGRLYRGLGTSALQRLDAFEGAWYLRRRVLVSTGRGRAAADVYVWHPAQRKRLTANAWSADDFAGFQRRRYAAFWLRARRRTRQRSTK